MSDVGVWIDREDKVIRLVIDGVEQEIKLVSRIRITLNFWHRDLISIFRWYDGWEKKTTIKGLFEFFQN